MTVRTSLPFSTMIFSYRSHNDHFISPAAASVPLAAHVLRR